MYIPSTHASPAIDPGSVASAAETSLPPTPCAADWQRFLEYLGDPRYWVTSSRQDDLIRQLAHALMVWPVWPRQMGLCVMTGHPSRALVEDHRLTVPRILITISGPNEPAEFTVSVIRPGKSTPESEVMRYEPPSGLFKAVAGGFRMARTLAPMADDACAPALLDGEWLRQALVSWMRERPDVALRLSEPWQWQLLSRGPRDVYPLPQLLAGPVTSAAAPASVADVRAFAQRLRQGEWSREMEAVLCMWLVRAPDPRWHPPTGILKVARDDHWRSYTSSGMHFTPNWGLLVEPDGTVYRSTRSGMETALVTSCPAPDRFLLAYLRDVLVLTTKDVQGFRRHMADALDTEPSLCRLLLTIMRRCPDHPDWDYLVRQCVVGGVLSLEGLQMMAPGFKEWQASYETAAEVLRQAVPGTRHRDWLFERGLPLLTFNELLTPLGPSGPLRRAGMLAIESLLPRGARKLVGVMPELARELPWLLHTHRCESAVSFKLGVSQPRMRELVGGSEVLSRLKHQAMTFASTSPLAIDDAALARVPVRSPSSPANPVPGSSGARQSP